MKTTRWLLGLILNWVNPAPEGSARLSLTLEAAGPVMGTLYSSLLPLISASARYTTRWLLGLMVRSFTSPCAISATFSLTPELAGPAMGTLYSSIRPSVPWSARYTTRVPSALIW